MKGDELMDVVVRINSQRKNKMDEGILRQVVALVVKNPLDDDRGVCQEQIAEIISQRLGVRNHAGGKD